MWCSYGFGPHCAAQRLALQRDAHFAIRCPAPCTASTVYYNIADSPQASPQLFVFIVGAVPTAQAPGAEPKHSRRTAEHARAQAAHALLGYKI